jgi:hypothetical protein
VADVHRRHRQAAAQRPAAPATGLSSEQIAELKKSPRTAIVVLGGGRRLLAPEYGVATLTPRSIERLRYGVWLARETGLPLAFSGGVGHGAKPARPKPISPHASPNAISAARCAGWKPPRATRAKTRSAPSPCCSLRASRRSWS